MPEGLICTDYALLPHFIGLRIVKFRIIAPFMEGKVKTFATVALLEGVSYVLLLVVAMPLKYMFGFPFAVQVVGWAHGVLFMLYVSLLMLCWLHYKWSMGRVLKYFLASLLPVVPFIVERRLRQEYALPANLNR